MSNVTSESIGLSVNLYDILYNINEASEGWFIGLLLIVLYVLVFSLTNDRLGFAKSTLYTGFSVFLLSLLFWSLEMISFVYAIIFFVIMLSAMYILFTEGDV